MSIYDNLKHLDGLAQRVSNLDDQVKALIDVLKNVKSLDELGFVINELEEIAEELY
jgi:hypothetical protein